MTKYTLKEYRQITDLDIFLKAFDHIEFNILKILMESSNGLTARTIQKKIIEKNDSNISEKISHNTVMNRLKYLEKEGIVGLRLYNKKRKAYGLWYYN